ncbi:hypothetical protein V500_10416, partial [Pseudogymnoascus sp. VKM F-4518 (FW-2643)]
MAVRSSPVVGCKTALLLAILLGVLYYLSTIPTTTTTTATIPIKSSALSNDTSIFANGRKITPTTLDQPSDLEILLRIPPLETKTSWISRGSTLVAVTRGNESITTGHAYLSRHSIVVVIPHHSANILHTSLDEPSRPSLGQWFVEILDGVSHQVRNTVPRAVFLNSTSAHMQKWHDETIGYAHDVTSTTYTMAYSTLSRASVWRNQAVGQVQFLTNIWRQQCSVLGVRAVEAGWGVV